MAAENPYLKRIDIPTLLSEKEAFHTRIIGQDAAVDAFATLYAKLRSGIRSSKRGPVDAKFLAGPSGVGKTEIVYTLADLLSQGETAPASQVIKLNCGEYQEQSSLSRLFGSAPGYIGSVDPRHPGGTEPVFSRGNLDKHRITYLDNSGQEKSVIIILVDEAEKAHDTVHKAFLGVLDKGTMDLANNESVDMTDTLIIYTSNVGNQEADQARSEMEKDPNISPQDRQTRTKEIMSQAFKDAFPPEFRGRIQDLVIFENLDEEALRKIAEIKMRGVEEQFAENNIHIKLNLSGEALEWIIAQGYNPSEGARALQKAVDRFIHDQLILAHVGIGIDKRVIHIDKLEEEAELAFFFNEAEQVTREEPVVEFKPEVSTPAEFAAAAPSFSPTPTATFLMNEFRAAAQAAQARTAPTAAFLMNEFKTAAQSSTAPLPDTVISPLLASFRTQGISGYIQRRNELVREGIIPDAETADNQLKVREYVSSIISQGFQTGGLEGFINIRNQLVRARMFTEGNVNSFIKSDIREFLKKRLQMSMLDFTIARERVVREGIGTETEWNEILKQK